MSLLAHCPILALPQRYDVSEAVRQIEACPSAWNRYRHRLDAYGSPHSPVSDIWVRYRDIAQLGPLEPGVFFNTEHESVWYPVADEIPAVRALACRLYRDVGGKRLGGVLITRIPPGEQVKPHVDAGWHAGFYEKYAIQLAGHPKQAFHFEGVSLSAPTGAVYTFDNSKRHWVTNDSDVPRMTMIVCLKR